MICCRDPAQGCIFRLMCSYSELTKDHVLTSVYVKIFRTITRNAVNKSDVMPWRTDECYLKAYSLIDFAITLPDGVDVDRLRGGHER